jgi:Domain of unknown function (DUF4279)
VTTNMQTHSYTVELRIYGEGLDPDLVTRETGLQPCQTRKVGSSQGNRKDQKAMWAFDANGPSDWSSLEDGLSFVLDAVERQKSSFEKYQRSFELVWWCGHFQSSFDGGPKLSPSILIRLGAFGAPLYIDNYFSRGKTE